MRILITGFVILVIWSFFSMWLYVDILKPQTKHQVIVQPVPQVNREADSLAKLYALMPKELRIYFDFDKSEMLPSLSADGSISDFKSWIEKYPGAVLIVTGRSDFIGTTEYNQKLSAARAETVRKFLAGKGIPDSKIEIATAGPEQSLLNQITSAERAESRRTEVTIKK